MEILITGLLGYVRVQGRTAQKELFSVEHAIDNICQNILSQDIEAQKAKISYENLPEIYAYKSMITQVFQNLIQNSIKYSRVGHSPKISIKCEDRSDHWLFSVKDNGIGINPAYFERIFDIFQKLSKYQNDDSSGIGLSICKGVIEKHGGKIWLESDEGKGSIFFFTLPKEDIERDENKTLAQYSELS